MKPLLYHLLSQQLQADCRGRWWDRLSVDLSQHIGRSDLALDVCKAGLEDPNVRTGHKLALAKRARRIAQSKRSPELAVRISEFPCLGLREPDFVTITGIVLDAQGDPSRGQKLSFLYEGQSCSVEDLVIHHAERHGWRGRHCEGSLFMTIFGLLMWDIIFADIPNVFCCRFQSAPLDFRTDAFFRQRQSMIEKRLSFLQTANLALEIEKVVASRLGQEHVVSGNLVRPFLTTPLSGVDRARRPELCWRVMVLVGPCYPE
eukprot:m.181821 g.181821  ORF g.181821 m.181821 type:complete len:260 (-) comp10475_c0_seq4:409-1188(-)